MTYALVHILKPVMKMSLFFQRKDINIGSVQTVVESCLGELNELLNYDDQQLEDDLIDGVFKGHHVVTKSSYSFETTRRNFITALIENVNKRFPEKQLMTSMCIFGMRPVPHISSEELRVWGDEPLETLLDQFAVAKSHTYKEPVTGEQTTSTTNAVVSKEETIEEWRQVKQTHGYPVNSTVVLWSLINKYHAEQFPNLIKLAVFVLTHPVHTADCERAFSSQNLITTPLRNRLSPEHCDQLMRVMLEGPPRDKFDFISALKHWRLQKRRAIFV